MAVLLEQLMQQLQSGGGYANIVPPGGGEPQVGYVPSSDENEKNMLIEQILQRIREPAPAPQDAEPLGKGKTVLAGLANALSAYGANINPRGGRQQDYLSDILERRQQDADRKNESARQGYVDQRQNALLELQQIVGDRRDIRQRDAQGQARFEKTAGRSAELQAEKERDQRRFGYDKELAELNARLRQRPEQKEEPTPEQLSAREATLSGIFAMESGLLDGSEKGTPESLRREFKRQLKLKEAILGPKMTLEIMDEWATIIEPLLSGERSAPQGMMDKLLETGSTGGLRFSPEQVLAIKGIPALWNLVAPLLRKDGVIDDNGDPVQQAPQQVSTVPRG
jgi:hypothetical protein